MIFLVLKEGIRKLAYRAFIIMLVIARVTWLPGTVHVDTSCPGIS